MGATGTLRQGARGSEVGALHRLLRRLGYSLPDDELTEALFGRRTLECVRETQLRFRFEATGEVDDQLFECLRALVEERGGTPTSLPSGDGAKPAPSYIVHGVLRQARGGFAVGATVRAVDADLRHEQPLGNAATTNARGEYRIEYKASDFANAEVDSADLFVRAYDSAGKLLAESQTVFNAPADATIDLVAGGDQYLGPSEYERLVARITLALDGVAPQDLTFTDANWLAHETGLALNWISVYALASSLAASTSISAEVFYALLRESSSSSSSSLYTRPATELAALLADAIARNIIGVHDDAWIKSVVARLQGHASSVLLRGGASSLGAALSAANVPAASQQAFAQAYLGQSATTSQLWQGLTATLGAAAVAQLQTGMQWTALTFNHAPLVSALTNKLSKPSDAATLTTADWRSTIDQLAAGGQQAVPDRVQGPTEDARRSFYAQQLYAFAQSSFPAVALSTQLKTTSPGTALGAQQFLAANPDWDIQRVPARAFLASHPTDTQTAVVLGQVQRVHKVTSQATWTAKLVGKGLTSAQSIARASIQTLAGALSATPTEARAVRDRAQSIVDTAAMIHARFSRTLNMPSVPSVPQMQDVAAEHQTYQDVFGPAPLCGCDECGSVLGPSAYLVDLFQFLQTWSQPAWNELFTRRPDLKGVELSCANTLTPLPLIDLANETLEDIAQGQPPAARQTTWSAADLAANPEHLAFAAYVPLTTATYPWTLPFDLSLEEARVYLQHLGVSRYDVMLTLGSSTTPDETTLATELLRMTAAEWTTIATAAIVADGQTDPNWGNQTNAQLTPVHAFLKYSGLAAADLPPLFSTQFVNPDSTALADRIGISTPDNLCNPETATILNLHGDGMDRIRRFVRLQRRLGWTFLELDAAVTAVASGTLDAPGLLRIARFERIRRATQLSVMELLTWWTPLSIVPGADGRSQYEDVFVSRAGISVATSEGNAATPDPLVLDNGGEPQGAGVGVTLRTVLPRIIAALNITADDADALIAPDLNTGLDAPLSRANLAALYRALSLSRAAGLASVDYGRLRRMSTLQPFANDIDSARRLLDVAVHATASALSLVEWAFLLRGEPIDSFNLDDPSITVFLTELRTALQTIDAERTAASLDPDPLGVVRRKLAQLVKGADLAAAIAFLDEAQGTSLASLPAPLTLLGLSPPTITLLTTPTSPTDANVAARYLLVRDALLDYLALLDKTSLIIKRAAATTGIAVDLASALVQGTQSVSFAPPAGQSLLQVLLAPAVVDNTVTIDPATTALAAAYRGLRLYGKQALLARRLSLVVDELITIQSEQAMLGWIDWTRFPAQASDAALSWDSVAGLLAYIAIRKSQPRGRAPLWELFGVAASLAFGSPADPILVELANRTGWENLPPNATSAANLGALATALGFTKSDAYKTIDAYVKLAAAVALASRMGLPGKTVAGWAAAVTPSLAADIKGAARSKHSGGDWLSIAKALRDPLREKQRDALLSYLIGSKGMYADANAAFDTLLIDVQMSACMRTSRIKQGIGSTQLFIERCLLGSEGDALKLPPEAQWQWKWMRDYRVWEANRQVFLYPENWLQPELRTDKTQFFQELEDELHQKDITASNAEDALHHYLEKLDSVAKLEISGFISQPDAFNALSTDETSDHSAVHVVGRTPGAPASYYYRRLERGWHWTAWEKINVDLTGDHVVPFIWHRRLFLFWLEFQEKTDPSNQRSSSLDTSNNAVSTSNPLPPPPKHLDIRIAWSERKDDRWLPRRMSTSVLVADPCDNSELPRFDINCYTEDGDAGPLHVQVIFSGPFGSDETPADQTCRVGEFVFDSCTAQPSVTQFNVATGQQIIAPQRCDRAGLWFAETTGTESSVNDPFIAWMIAFAALAGVDLKSLLADQAKENADDSLYLLRGPGTLNVDIARAHTAKAFSIQVLAATPGLFTLSWPHYYAEFFSTALFFWDQQRVFYVKSESPIRTQLVDSIGMSPAVINAATQAFLPPPPPPPPGPGANPGAAAIERINRANTPNTIGDLEQTRMVDVMENVSGDAVGLVPATDDSSSTPSNPLYRFYNHYHPYACTFLERVDRYGVDGFYAWSDDPVQQKAGETPVQLLDVPKEFATDYQPVQTVVDPNYPEQNVDFSPCGAYSQYNWEAFLHIPVYIANRMRTEQSFEEALRWLHFVYDPTSSDTSVAAPQRYWKMLRLRQEDPQSDDIVNLLQNLAEGKDLGASNDCEAETLTAQIRLWRHDPFDPHAIARLRPVAYMKWVFNLYVQTLIDWGDLLFKQNTIESINLATLRYVMAAELLGDRPDPIPLSTQASPLTYQQMLSSPGGIDAFSDELENLVPQDANNDPEAARFPISYGPGQVFCIPPNDQLFTLWDTVADRLFKIRHCMNIQGQIEQLPLFEPPINPALLIAAEQAGVDLESAVNATEAPIPRYRFAVVYERARELVNELRQLGNALQAALEKRDAEDLALLRSSNEIALLTAVRDIKLKQIDETNASHDALIAAQAAMQTRVTYYQQKSQELANAAEATGMALMIASQIIHIVAQGLHTASGVLAVIPQFKLGVTGVGGSPTATAEYGGQQIKEPVGKTAVALEALGSSLSLASSISTTIGGYLRRQDDLSMQRDAGLNELANLNSQIVAAEIRQAIARKDFDNHELQTEQASGVDSFLRSKFTNRDLYDWMAGQVSAIYFQTYQLAFDMARRAERSFRFELGLFDDQRTFIQFGYWDNLKQGLLAGERLAADLLRLQSTYIEENKRELELTKHVSLALTDPIALLALRQDGTCYVSLGEQLFDLDAPGLYLRRIKSVGLSIPCVSGTYVTIACKLTLISDSVRINANLLNNQYTRQAPNVENRFVDTSGSTQSIITSSAQNDAGLFEVNLRDERYLPFEGAGAISQWKLELVKEAQQFDWTTISDAVLHVRYTARDGGDFLRQGAISGLTKALQSGVRLFSVRSEFPDALAEFLNPPAATPGQTMTLPLADADFPYPVQGKSPKLGEWLLLIRWADGTYGNLSLSLTAPKPAAGPQPAVNALNPWPPPNLANSPDTMAIDWAAQSIAEQVQAFSCPNAGLGAWTLAAAAGDLAKLSADKLDANGHINADAFDDLVIVVGYAV